MIKNTLINNEAIFFGGYAANLYSKFDKKSKEIHGSSPDFDVLYEDPKKLALIITEELERNNLKNIKTVEYNPIGELIPYRIEIKVNNESCLFIYKPVACHNYNKIKYNNQQLNIATIDTILSFYLAFYYFDLPQYNKERLHCTAAFLAGILESNKLDESE